MNSRLLDAPVESLRAPSKGSHSNQSGENKVTIRSASIAAAIVIGVTSPALATAAPAQAPRAAAAQAQPTAQQAPTRAAVLKNLEAGFKSIDTNGDGSLNQQEVAAAEAKRQQQRVTGVRSRLEAEFGKLDTNKDGQLSRAEFMAAAPTSAGASNAANLLGQLDKNKDGKVTIDEYRAPILAQFDRLDTNKDGTISATERKAAQASAPRR